MLQFPTVGQLIRQLVAGEMTLDELAAEFARRDWKAPPMSREAIMGGEEVLLGPNDWSAVEAARQSGCLTAEQYRVLDDARGPLC